MARRYPPALTIKHHALCQEDPTRGTTSQWNNDNDRQEHVEERPRTDLAVETLPVPVRATTGPYTVQRNIVLHARDTRYNCFPPTQTGYNIMNKACSRTPSAEQESDDGRQLGDGIHGREHGGEGKGEGEGERGGITGRQSMRPPSRTGRTRVTDPVVSSQTLPGHSRSQRLTQSASRRAKNVKRPQQPTAKHHPIHSKPHRCHRGAECFLAPLLLLPDPKPLPPTTHSSCSASKSCGSKITPPETLTLPSIAPLMGLPRTFQNPFPEKTATAAAM